MIIGDRGFCDLWTLAEKKFYGSLAKNLLTLGSDGWQAQNAWNFLMESKNREKPCYKVVVCDIADEIVCVNASLMVGIAKQVSHLKTNLKRAHSPSYMGVPGILSDT
mmetsp:Transcript_21839/g.33815  ORF Transcript_21839/g.33815 Transcript_21839/m.33815 type:complete len:107 (+) Transcript_21839:2368-2688(+)